MLIMTREDKELLLKDLCARLPYGVVLEQTYKVTVITTNTEEVLTRKIELYSINTLDDMTVSGIHNDGEEEICFFDEVKPYLFPMSSMSEEQYNEFFSYFHNIEMAEVKASGDYLKAAYLGENAKRDWLNKNHFDYHYLIPKGLAIDATGKNIYKL